MKPRIPKTVGVVAHSGKPETRGRLLELLAVLREHHVAVLLEREAAVLAGKLKLARLLPADWQDRRHGDRTRGRRHDPPRCS